MNPETIGFDSNVNSGEVVEMVNLIDLRLALDEVVRDRDDLAVNR